MIRVLAIYCCVALFGLLTFSAEAQGDNPVPALDIVIALDVSGSMSIPANRNNFTAIDVGLRRLFDDRILQNQMSATDPDNVRFSTTATLIEWLASYGYHFPDTLNVSVSIVRFADEPSVVLDWQALSRTDDGRESFVSAFDPASENNGAGNANFIALYELIKTQFDKRARQANARKAVVVVTDSVPCFPSGIRHPSYPLYDEHCQEVPSMVRHINALSKLEAAEHVVFMNPVGEEMHWEAYPDLRSAWVNHVGATGGSFREINTISELPVKMIDAVLREVGVALGAIDSQTSGSTPVDARTYADIGITYVENGFFRVAPFQSYMEIMIVMPDSKAPINFTRPDGVTGSSDILYDTSDRLARAVRVTRPEVGLWNVNRGIPDMTPVWALFRSGEAQLTVSPATVNQYDSFALHYSLVDRDGAPFPITAETAPIADVKVSMPSSRAAASLSLVNFYPSNDGNALVSQSIVALAPGAYSFTAEFTPGQGNLWRNNTHYGFLQPDLPHLNVLPVSFQATYEVPNRRSGEGDNRIGLTMPRSLPLEITLHAIGDGNRQLAFPDGLSAQVTFGPPKNTALEAEDICPDEPIQLSFSADKKAASASVRFEEAGDCELDIEIRFASPLLPLSNEIDNSVPVLVPGNARRITVTPTQRLHFGLVSETGDYHLVAPLDLGLNPNELLLRLEVRDEGNQLTAPIFLPNAADSVPSNCHAALLRPADESSQTESGDDQTVIDPSSAHIVPFRLQVLDSSEQDFAAQNGVCFYETDREGVYMARLTGLPAGSYTVGVSVDRNSPPLDDERHEWSSTLFATSQTVRGQEALITVNHNWSVILSYGAIALALLLLVLLIILLFMLHKIRTKAPVLGRPAIYRIEKNVYEDLVPGGLDAAIKPLWSPKQLPVRNRIEYGSKAFVGHPDLIALGVKSLLLTTNRDAAVSKAEAFFCDLQTGGGMPLDKQLLSMNTAAYIKETSNGDRYYLANGLEDTTPRDLMRDAKVQKQEVNA